MKPAAHTPDGKALWLTGEIIVPRQYGQWYWTPQGAKQVVYGGGIARNPYPLLSEKPVLQHPFLAGRIDQHLRQVSSLGNEHSLALLREVRPFLWGESQ